MAEFPYLRQGAPRETAIYQFSGLDRRPRVPDGALRDGRNIDPDGFPCLVTAPPRARTQTLTGATDLIAACGGLGWVADGAFYWNGVRRGGVREQAHQMAVIGRKIVIFPEKLYLDADQPGALRNLEAKQMGRADFAADRITLTQDAVFSPGDGVTISGCVRQPDNNKTAVVRAVEGKTLIFSADCFAPASENSVTLHRQVPDLDFVCEKDNRLWGTHDGKICCSVLGNPCNWNVFEGLAGDGWETAVGTDGGFTGCAAAASHVLFFKEDCVHKVYGVKPSNFQVQVSRIPGVQAGCARSVVNAGETLYWWARGGLMAYGGGIPDRLSAPLGETPWEQVCAGTAGHLLYLSGLRGGQAALVAYSLESGQFAPCDGTLALAFAQQDGVLHYVTADGLWQCGAGPAAQTEWEAVLGPFEEVKGETRVLSRLTLLVEPDGTCELTAALQTDGGDFTPFWGGCGAHGGTLRIPLPLQRGRRFAIRLAGRGPATVRAVLRRTQDGGVW